MFTGIVTDIGTVRSVRTGGDVQLEFSTGYDMSEVSLGASVCCSGVCLTVVDKSVGQFAVSVSGETLSRTTIGKWTEGTRINMERALRVGDELGGHIVFGHVDGVCKVASIRTENASHRVEFEISDTLERFIAEKGSVALDGVSLTVNEVGRKSFGVNLIPHTLEATTLGRLRPGDCVNVEVDMLARYVARILEAK